MGSWVVDLPQNGDGTLERERFLRSVWIVSLLVLIGGGLQGYANSTMDTFFVAFFFLGAGLLLVRVLFLRDAELHAFLLTFAICIFAGGLAQCYSLMAFGNIQSTTDALFFLKSISATPPFVTMGDFYWLLDSCLAIVIWQQFYKVVWWLGLDSGPYIGVMFNAFVMGMAASITVRIARELFGNDSWRLLRTGTLFALCGLFILFGAVLIRDSFTTFLNTVVLWRIMVWLIRSNAKNLLIALAVTGVSSYAMFYLRVESLALFGIFWFLSVLFLFFSRRMDTKRWVAALVFVCVIVAVEPYLANYFQLIKLTQTAGMMGYNELTSKESTEESLGARLLVNQPLPVRVVLNSALSMVYPIPLWAYFKIGMGDYNWIKGYHGVYQVIVLPLVFAGFLGVIRLFRRDRKQGTPLLFLVTYLVLNIVAVSATSGEQRHLGQFMPAFMILAALPDTRDPKSRRELGEISKWWIAVVIFVHLAWMIMKG